MTPSPSSHGHPRYENNRCRISRGGYTSPVLGIAANSRAFTSATTPKGVFVAATSVPCFEYWFLLHFLYSTRPYNAVPGNSACNQLISELKNYLPDYAKGRKHIYEELLQQLEFAKSNAERSLAAGKAQGNDNPSTRIHELVDYLQELKTPKT